MSLLDVLFPKRCVTCKKAGEYLCPNCFSKLSFFVSPRCLICGNPSLDGLTHPICKTRYSIDGCFSGIAYTGVAKKLLYTFKYSPYLSDLSRFLGELLYESLVQNETYMAIVEAFHPTIVPIPLTKKKFNKRGYNQAALLGKELSLHQELLLSELLLRSHETKPQYGLSKEERRENMKGAFEVHATDKRQNSECSTVFLIDDVVTTGSTLVEAANVLKRHGVVYVWGVTLAQD